MSLTKTPFENLYEWARTTRIALLNSEGRNVVRRAKGCEDIVNSITQEVCEQLIDDLTKCSIPLFSFIVEPADHLQFIVNWNGLKIIQTKTVPKSQQDYERRANNWLNGRRAPQYGTRLFPLMISSANAYAKEVAAIIFQNDRKRSHLFYNVLVYKYLATLCNSKISLNDTSKKVHLICENSVKTGTSKLSQILQQYALDHPYPMRFPSHLKEAVDFFLDKFEEYRNEFAPNFSKPSSNSVSDDNGNNSDEKFSFFPSNPPQENSLPSLTFTNSTNSVTNSVTNSTNSSNSNIPMDHTPNNRDNNNSFVFTQEKYNQLITAVNGVILKLNQQQITIKTQQQMIDSLKSSLHNSELNRTTNSNQNEFYKYQMPRIVSSLPSSECFGNDETSQVVDEDLVMNSQHEFNYSNSNGFSPQYNSTHVFEYNMK